MLRPITFQYIAAALMYVLQLKIDHTHTQFRFAHTRSYCVSAEGRLHFYRVRTISNNQQLFKVVKSDNN